MKATIPSFLFFMFPLISVAQQVSDEKTNHYFKEDKDEISVLWRLCYRWLDISFSLASDARIGCGNVELSCISNAYENFYSTTQ